MSATDVYEIMCGILRGETGIQDKKAKSDDILDAEKGKQ